MSPPPSATTMSEQVITTSSKMERGFELNTTATETNTDQKKDKLTPLQQISQGAGGITLPGIPSFVSFSAARSHRLNHMAAVFRHWSRQGYVFGFSGHISYRDPEFPETFWTNPLGVHFGLLKASDMILLNLKGEIVSYGISRGANLDLGSSSGIDTTGSGAHGNSTGAGNGSCTGNEGNGPGATGNNEHVNGTDNIGGEKKNKRRTRRPANTAGFLIHAAIHEARPDVDAACHCHSPYGRAWSATGRRLDMITQDVCKFLGEAHSVYANYGGVVLGAQEGENIARALGPKGKGVILKNHGLLTVGKTVDEAGWLFDVMEAACRDQLAWEASLAGIFASSCSSSLPPALSRALGGRESKDEGQQRVREEMLIGEEQAKLNFELEGDPEYCYAEFQVYYEYEMAMSKVDFADA